MIVARHASERSNMAAAGRTRKGKVKPKCEDCFFRCRGLCALELAEPCAIFRPDLPQGLVPPQQLQLLNREPDGPAAGALAQSA